MINQAEGPRGRKTTGGRAGGRSRRFAAGGRVQIVLASSAPKQAPGAKFATWRSQRALSTLEPASGSGGIPTSRLASLFHDPAASHSRS